MAVLNHLEPQGVFHFFEEICAIPHGSHHNTQISNWLVKFAEDRGLEHYQDAAENVIIIKPATPGYENSEPVIIQGHMDMVCEQTPECTKDMTKEGLDLELNGDIVSARGTTLGGDDGIAVAMALAILDSQTMEHPRLEVVITTDEEIGMDGAMALDVSPLKARRFMNIDSEVEGVFTVSCAGGAITKVSVPVQREAFAGTALTISVEGLIGGHSGTEIHKGRANADMLLGRVLCAASNAAQLRIVSVNGGLKANAIPTAASAVIVTEQAEAVKAAVAKLDAALRQEYASTDAGVAVRVTEGGEGVAMDAESTQRMLLLLTCAPNGVQEMSPDIEGLVQTSLNLGILTTAAECVEACFCIRSSVDSQKEMLLDRIAVLCRQLNGTMETSGDYPGWAYRQDSPLRDLLSEVFTEQYGHEPVIEALHAGLECGLFSGKMPGLDCISFGPDLKDIHTPRETMSVSSVQRVWKMVAETLRRMK